MNRNLPAVTSGRLQAIVVGVVIAFLLLALAQRVPLFADGGWLLIRNLRPDPLFVTPRITSDFVYQIPMRTAVLMGVTSFRVMELLYGVGVLGHFVLMLVICWKASPSRRELIFFPVASFFLVSANLIFFSFTGSHLVVSGYWVLLFVLLLPPQWSVGWALVAVLAAAALVASYESMIVLGWIILVAAIWRFRRESSPILKSGAALVGVLTVASLVVAVIGVRTKTWRLIHFDMMDGGVNGMLVASIAAFLIIATGARWKERWWNAAMVALVSFWLLWLVAKGMLQANYHGVWAQREIRLLNLLGPLALSIPFFWVLWSRTPISIVARDRAWRVLAVAAFAQLEWLALTSSQWFSYLRFVEQEAHVQAGIIPYASSILGPDANGAYLTENFRTKWSAGVISLITARDGRVRAIIANPTDWKGWVPFDPQYVADDLFYLKRYGFNFDEFLAALPKP
jgi:hypothetical protein